MGNSTIINKKGYIFGRDTYSIIRLESYFLKENQIKEERERIILEAMEKLFLGRDDAILAMIYYDWNTDKLDTWYDNKEQNKINSGIVISEELKAKFQKDNIESNGDICLICEEIYKNNLDCLSCGHQFCEECWTNYLKQKLNFPITVLEMECPQNECTCRVYEKFYYKYIKDEKLLSILNKAIYNNFIDKNKDISQCPNPKCHYFFKTKNHSNQEIKCLCKTSYCYKCSRESHNPCPCDLIQKWNILLNNYFNITSNEVKNNIWILENTKECPNCHIRLEKINGCSSMVCDKKIGGCGHKFCNICGIDWENHSETNYNCNKYIFDVINGEEKNNILDENRLFFYYIRYKNYINSIETCDNLKIIINEKIKIIEFTLSDKKMDLSLMNEALNCIIDSKKNLMNSYIFAYFMQDNNEKQLYEHSQGILESNTEKLHISLNNLLEMIDIDVNKFQILFEENGISIINLISVVNKFRKAFIEEIENKYISYLDNNLLSI